MKHIRTATIHDLINMKPPKGVIVQLPTHFTAGVITSIGVHDAYAIEVEYQFDTSTGSMKYTWIGGEDDEHAFFVTYDPSELK